MKHLFTQKILLLILISLTTMVHGAFSQNVVQNGGFETATIGLPSGTSFPSFPSILDYWSAVNTDGEFMYDDTLAHSGTGFMSVLQNGGANPVTDWLGAPASFGGYDRAMQLVPVSSNTTYILQFWVRSGEGLRYDTYGAGTFLAQIEQYEPTPATIDTIQGLTTPDWEYKSLTFTTSDSCTEIAVLFSGYSPQNNDVWVDDVEISSGKPNGIGEIISAEEASVYPNPSAGNFYIGLKNFPLGNVELKVVNDLGQEMYVSEECVTASDFKKEVQLEVSSGIYFLQIRNGNNFETQTIIVQ